MKSLAIAAAGALLLAACQPDNKPVTVAATPTPAAETIPPTTNDVRELAQYFMDRLMLRQAGTSGMPPGTRVIANVPKDIQQKGESTIPNLMRIEVQSGGEPLRLVKRMPVKLGGDILHGAALEGAGYSGDLTLIVASPYLPRAFGDVFAEYGKPPAPGEERFRRGNIEAAYRFYASDKQLNCFAFVENGLAAGLKGDVCAPAGRKISKPQAEAIIKAIGADSFMPLEPSSDLVTLQAIDERKHDAFF